MRPEDVKQEWVRLAGDAFDNSPREPGDYALRGPMAAALAAVLPSAVAEARAAGAAEMRERAAGAAEHIVITHARQDGSRPFFSATTTAAAIRALPLPAGGAGWRDIETAPRDGKSILCYAPGTPDRAAVRRTDYWWIEKCAFAHMRPSQPYTKWQPLPAAPEEGG